VGKYHSQSRHDMAQLLVAPPRRVLDVGCGEGAFLSNLKDGYGCEVWGIEPNQKVAQVACRTTNNIIVGRFEEAGKQVPAKYFDAIFFNGIVEHMVDPGQSLQEAKNYFADDGAISALYPHLALDKRLPARYRAGHVGTEPDQTHVE
jgi:ubiquinone/menaquinone biosynthesis C-methylase UbiE